MEPKGTMIDLKLLNELMSNKNRQKFRVKEEKGHQGIRDGGYQGEYNERFEYFKHPDIPENIFLKITYQTDSYGSNEGITEMTLVEGKAKTITVFEPIA